MSENFATLYSPQEACMTESDQTVVVGHTAWAQIKPTESQEGHLA